MSCRSKHTGAGAKVRERAEVEVGWPVCSDEGGADVPSTRGRPG